MNFNYIFSDILIRIKNGYNLNHKYVEIPHTYLASNILKLLYKEGLISNYFIKLNTINYLVKLKYSKRKTLFNQVIFISKPGRRIYCTVKLLKRKYWYKPFVIVSTTKGLMLHREAVNNNLGGEVMCVIEY